MKTETFTFDSENGVKIFYYKWSPDDGVKPLAAVQIAHGMAEHAARYERFAEYLAAAGYIVYANDHRGHYKSAGRLDNTGFFAENDGWKLAVNDLHTLTGIIKKENMGLPVYLFGHSMGTFLFRNYLYIYSNEELKGVVLSGTGGNPGILGKVGVMIAKVEKSLKGPRHRSSLLNGLSFGSFNKPFRPNRTDFDWLSRDQAEVDKYVADPYCGFVCTTSFFVDMLGGIIDIHKPENVNKTPKTLPVYFFAGEKDPVGNFSRGVTEVFNMYKNAGLKDVTCKFYKDGRHEMLNELNRDEVFADVKHWLDSHL